MGSIATEFFFNVFSRGESGVGSNPGRFLFRGHPLLDLWFLAMAMQRQEIDSVLSRFVVGERRGFLAATSGVLLFLLLFGGFGVPLQSQPTKQVCRFFFVPRPLGI